MPKSSGTAGGENFAAIPCLNDTPGGMAVIRDIVTRELEGWLILAASPDHFSPSRRRNSVRSSGAISERSNP